MEEYFIEKQHSHCIRVLLLRELNEGKGEYCSSGSTMNSNKFQSNKKMRFTLDFQLWLDVLDLSVMMMVQPKMDVEDD